MNSQSVIALLGRRDEPTDGVGDYCRFLGQALRTLGVELELDYFPWAERGWRAAGGELKEKAKAWKGRWVLVQYTALAWSARGFPQKFLAVLNPLRDAGVRLAIVFHDVEPYSGRRLVDQLRRHVQLYAMRRALQLANLGIFTIDLDAISWLRGPFSKCFFIPVGANVPLGAARCERKPIGASPQVAVFGITGGEAGRTECRLIVEALKPAAHELGRLRLHVFGRGARDFECELRSGLRDVSVEVHVDGILPPQKIAEALRSSDVLLFVRGPISSRRGSAIAGIACGLPVIAYRGRETAAPVTNAGVVLVSEGSRAEFGEAVLRVLADHEYQAKLAARSQNTHKDYFDWDAIALRYAAALGVQSETISQQE
jgi:glycosyltransferase involved in cell wall biosynthesis